MDNDLKTYLKYKKERDRLNRETSEVVRLIAVKQKEIEKLEEEKSYLVYQARDITEIMQNMEKDAQS